MRYHKLFQVALVIFLWCRNGEIQAKHLTSSALFDEWTTYHHIHRQLLAHDPNGACVESVCDLIAQQDDLSVLQKLFPLSPDCLPQHILVMMKQLIEEICLSDDPANNNEMHFYLANNLARWAFDETSGAFFIEQHKDTKYHYILYLIYTALASIFSGKGWRDWHHDTLDALKKAYEEKKTIKYLAGGADIVHLINHGIYSITVIDPLFPTQARYYPKDYELLVSEDIDRIDFTAVTLKRSHSELPVIVWEVFDNNNQLCGEIIFDRRVITADDLKTDEQNVLLISWNEWFSLASGAMGITPEEVMQIEYIHLKQLSFPFDQQHIINYCKVLALAKTDFCFIGFGSDIT